jgi:hypothetical protein
LDSEGGGDQNVDFPGLNFLKIPRRNFSPFGQIILGQTFANPFPAHIRAEDLDSLPFFFGNSHDILHRFLMVKMNDTYIVKRISDLACKVIGNGENNPAPKELSVNKRLGMNGSERQIGISTGTSSRDKGKTMSPTFSSRCRFIRHGEPGEFMSQFSGSCRKPSRAWRTIFLSIRKIDINAIVTSLPCTRFSKQQPSMKIL